MIEDLLPEMGVDLDAATGPRRGGTKPEDMPPWWPPERPPCHLQDGMMYRGADGRWYRADGAIVSRRERRAAGVR